MNRCSLWFVLLAFVLTMSAYLYFNYKPNNNNFLITWDKERGEICKTKSPDKQNRIFVILYWTTYFTIQDYRMGYGHDPFSSCQYKNCWATHEKSLLTKSDALIFLLFSINDSPLPWWRSDEQIWILFNHESPPTLESMVSVSNANLKEAIFNWTVSYMPNSDLYIPYGAVKKLETTRNMQKDIGMLVKGKKEMAVWLVSKCITPGRREEYTRELQQFVKVDIYGQCGQTLIDISTDEFFKMAERKYKFYLAFENSLCKNYVTEKFFGALRYNIVPIVYGSADYESIAPKKSYIDTNDFSSAKVLADYLTYLDNNHSAYMEYFGWKNSFEADTIQLNNVTFCKICERLNKGENQPTSHKNVWWNFKTESQC